MRLIIKELWAFIKTDFNIWFYLLLFILLFVIMKFSYSGSFYWNFINVNTSWPDRFMRFFLFFAIPWFLIAIPKLLLSGKKEVLKKYKFYVTALLIIAVISFDSACNLFNPILTFAKTFDEQLYLTKIISNLQGIPFMLLIFTVLFGMNRNIRLSDMGLRIRNVEIKPYLILIIAIIPMIVWAVFNNDFTTAYPGYKPWNFPSLFRIPKYLTAIIYEFIYGIDFISIEFAFRGLLVIFMAKYMGKDAVLPMAVVYCVLHLGKPQAEAISSFFGGYFLGVVALNTRSIAPGVILHLSLAWLMDIAAYIQHYAK